MAKAAKKKENVEKLSFEKCLENLQTVVGALEDGNTGLSESLVEYERGVTYLKRCHELLQAAEQKVHILSGIDADGNATTQRFDESAMSLEEKATKRSRRRTRKPESSPAEKANAGDDTGADVVDDEATLF